MTIESDQKKWIFHVGIHLGTITSRDSENPKPMDSLEQCRNAAETARREYASMDCQIWYCYAISPEGECTTLIESEYYNS